MKKLFALAIVAGMVFASCGTKTPEVQPEVDSDIETTHENEEAEAFVPEVDETEVDEKAE